VRWWGHEGRLHGAAYDKAHDRRSVPLLPEGAIVKWVTREHVKVDRVACPWLIRKYIDRDAEFLFVPASEVDAVAEREGATPFDTEGAKLGHRDGKCSFETIIEATSVFDLQVGQCYNTPTETDVDEVNVVDCAEPHQYEIYALPRHPAGPDDEYPGDDVINEFGDDECLGDTFEQYVGVSYESSELFAFVTAETWEAAGTANSSVPPTLRARS
jgi:hypothetical protein